MSGNVWRRYSVDNSNRALEFFIDRTDVGPHLDMDQPYQRGVVWGLTRKRNLIKSLVMGVPIPAILINDRFAAQFKHPGYTQDRCWMYAIVDGKQRVSTIQSFVNDEFTVPGEWFDDDRKHFDVPGPIQFSWLPDAYKRGFKNRPISVASGQFPTLAAEQELFDLINFGGLAQGEVDSDLDTLEAR